MTIKSRVRRLEALAGVRDDVTLAELVIYSFATVRDPVFEARLKDSALCALIMRSVYPGMVQTS